MGVKYIQDNFSYRNIKLINNIVMPAIKRFEGLEKPGLTISVKRIPISNINKKQILIYNKISMICPS